MARLDALLERLTRDGGSDLHLHGGAAPTYRIHGEMHPVPRAAVQDDATLRDLLREIVTAGQWKAFSDEGDLDFAYQLAGVGRFRGNYFEHEFGVGAAFRLIPETIVPFEQLGLPKVVASLAQLEAGLVLVTGPTGSGKSTTLASIIDLINRQATRHIVTLEDPLEFVHQNKRSVISHREVGRDTASFAASLRAALRQDADVILVGEMRDVETISLAIEGASMGVLVFGTLHTSSASKTIDRMIDAFPSDQQGQTRMALADSLAGVVSQILCKKLEGGRIGAHEVLIRAGGVVGAIREGKTAMLASIIGAGRGHGMQTLDDALAALVSAGVIGAEEAYFKATDKKRFAEAART